MPTPTIFEGINPRGTQTFIPCKDVSALPRSEQAVLGAKQFYDIDASALMSSNVTVTKTNNGWRVQTSASATYPFVAFPVYIPANTDIRFSCEVAITSGTPYMTVDGSNDGTNYTSIKHVSISANINDTFNSGNYKYYRFRLFSNFNAEASTDGDVIFSNILFTLASDTDRTFAPYAMTNRELTDKVMPFGSVILSSADDMDAQRPTGIYPFTTAPANSPENLTYGTLINIINSNGNEQQYVMKGSSGVIYMRSLTSINPRTWSSWFKFTGTVVS